MGCMGSDILYIYIYRGGYKGYMGDILGYIGIMEKKMEATI